MKIIKFLKDWTLIFSMAVGACVYLLFTNVDGLIPVGNAVGPVIEDILPVLIFAILYVTFCKIRLHDLKLQAWHGWLQAIRIALACAMVLLLVHMEPSGTRYVVEGALMCMICPTAAAAAVITEKLGGSIASMTVYTLIDNGVTALLIPLLFPLIENNPDMTFMTSFLQVLKSTVTVLILPFCCAMATRKWLPKLAEKIQGAKNLGFYMWAFNLSIVMGMTLHNILTTNVSGSTMTLLLIVPLFVTFFLFGIGKSVGHRYGDRITGGQAMGQKNTIVGIWLAHSYLNPIAAIAPCAYVVWQNTLNSWQLWCKDKYGKLLW